MHAPAGPGDHIAVFVHGRPEYSQQRTVVDIRHDLFNCESVPSLGSRTRSCLESNGSPQSAAPRVRAAPVQRTTASQVRNASVLATPTRSRGLLNCPRQVRSVSPSRTGGSNRLAFLANPVVVRLVPAPIRSQRNVSATPGTRRASTVDVVSTRSALRARSAGGSLPGLPLR